MFKKLFEKQEEPKPPYEVGEITDLIEGKVDFLVERIQKTEWDNDVPWVARGIAILKVTGAMNVEVKPIADRQGEIRNFAIQYNLIGKTRLLILAVSYTDSDDEKEMCRLIVDEVEW